MSTYNRTHVDAARDELMSHIHRCGVLKASKEQQNQWLDDTMEYMAERYPELTAEQIGELQQIGHRFCQPVIPHGRENTASGSEDTEHGEMAGAA